MNTLEHLKKAIYDAGFGDFAIIPATPLLQMRPVLEKAQAEDRYPEFVERDISKRIDPNALQASAKSIISLAMPYYTGDPNPRLPLHGTISRSAWGRDYHRVLQEAMDQVITYLKEHLGAKECTKAIDTSFLIDRALAIEAGLGFPGSNCSAYVPPFGSWVFLGEILVDVELPTTKKEGQDHWACPVECTACLRACPTNALFAPGKINPHRCISYLTQMSGPIPLELREKIGTKLWGCDICQQACPANHGVTQSTRGDFQPLLGSQIPLLPLLDLSKKDFQVMFGSTSMAWRGKNTIQRNTCIALGNEGNAQALPHLEKIANEHPSDLVKEAALWAVNKIKSKHSNLP